ncbi:hypothetical protein [Fodinibius halophilus]|uniref:Uncharacterized protein n=1 Tax=Fodinibius halophilus TaxID=1736908 RepID=A0A6M1T8Z1_9BACT|nr:hypothetical protein [Fodinibius halophilus]NGP89043.1 hypothetical protein [Fodinibius halophilus]
MKGIAFVITAGISCLMLVSSTSESVWAQNSGTVKGKVILSAQQTTVRFSGTRYGRPKQSSGSSQAAEDSVLIWLVGDNPPSSTPPQDPVILDQKNQQFNPVFLPVRQHGAVRIRNSDPVYHNVFRWLLL